MGFKTRYRHIEALVAACSPDMAQYQEAAIQTLRKAGVVVHTLPEEGDRQAFLASKLPHVHCSLHLLGLKYNDEHANEEGLSQAEQDFNHVHRFLELRRNAGFKMFVWSPYGRISSKKPSKQQWAFLDSVRHKIHSQMIYTTRSNAVVFVEDLRNIMEDESLEAETTKQLDILLLHNEVDLESASEVTTLLEDVATIERIDFTQSAGSASSQALLERIRSAGLLVIYFQQAHDWAQYFAQQVWRLCGGASSTTPILMIGDSEIPGSERVRFEAPKFSTLHVPNELIPLEIKMYLDQLTETILSSS